MKRPEDPLRLFEDPDAPASVAEAVRAARGPEPEPARLAELAVALGLPAPLPLVPPAVPPAGPAAGLAKAALTKAAFTKVAVTTLAAATLAGTVAVVAAVGLGGARHHAAVAPTTAVVAKPAPRAPEPLAEDDIADEIPVAPVGSSAPSAASPPSRRRHAHAPAAVEAPPPDAVSRLREEAALVQRAERLLATEPASALRLTEERRRRFPDGALDQEAEVVAIDALLRLGRRPEATARAHAFESTHAASLHARRIHRLLSD